jgi:hypothetical protein
MKKTQHVRPTTDRRNPDLHGYLYLPLERRAIRDEPVLSRLHRGQRRDNLGLNVYEVGDLPCSDYERGYMV